MTLWFGFLITIKLILIAWFTFMLISNGYVIFVYFTCFGGPSMRDRPLCSYLNCHKSCGNALDWAFPIKDRNFTLKNITVGSFEVHRTGKWEQRTDVSCLLYEVYLYILIEKFFFILCLLQISSTILLG